ncbi:TolC family protein [Pontibacter pamirensis]|uniref:TolC family protein n=1 Tax=Pontibacter pamirensis TaxID=2562824 RepID=UPI00138964C2|nr:TolC family protein [Pontibacter pamirensis]
MKKLITTLLFTMHVLMVIAQVNPVQTEQQLSPQEKFFSFSDYALPLLYDAAIQHSAEIENTEAAKRIASEEIQIGKRLILSGISLNSGYSYGTWFQFAGAGETTPSQWNAFSQPVRSNWNVGLGMSFSLLNILNRGNEITIRQMGLKQAESNRKLAEMEIRKEVIALYQQLTLSRTVLQNYQDAYQSASINKEISDKRFREGEIQVAEQIEAMEYYNASSLALQEAKNTYATNLLLLEERIGMTINTLISGK